jgi:hypothetical protein
MIFSKSLDKVMLQWRGPNATLAPHCVLCSAGDDANGANIAKIEEMFA